MTKNRMSPGGIIISIPKSFLITMETVLNSDIGSFLKRSDIKLSLQQVMSVFLILERRKQNKSSWWPYISVLPNEYDTPAFWKTNDIKLFSSKLFPKVMKELQDLQTFYDEVVNFLMTLTEISYEDFRWAWYCIHSRSIYYVNHSSPYLNDINKDIALAPVLDLLNHSTSAVVEAGFNKVNNCYEIKTLNSYRKYDQVFISYGAHSNSHLLTVYGFILPNNPHDVYEIEFDDIETIAKMLNLQLLDKKITIIADNHLKKKLVCSMEGMSWNLLTVLQILAMDFNELKSWKLVFSGYKASDENQQIVKQMGKTLLQEELKKVHSDFKKFSSMDLEKLNPHQKMAHDLLTIEENILMQSLKIL